MGDGEKMNQWKIQKKEKLHLQLSNHILFPSTLGKLETQTLGKSVIWNFSVWLILTKWQPFFNFFYNGQCWYSIFIDTQKTGNPNFQGWIIWNFSVWSKLTKWQPFFNFFIVANADIPFPLTLGKLETQTLGKVSNLKFFHMIDINEMAASF